MDSSSKVIECFPITLAGHVAVTKHRCEIVLHEELRQCDTLRLHVPGTRNNCSCECVCVNKFCPCCELLIKVPATFPLVCMKQDLTAAQCPRDM